PPLVHELEQGRALPARDDETVDVRQLFGLANLDGLDATTRQRLAVQREIALKGEDADLQTCYQPLVWRSSDSASLEVSMPAIASPRSSLTFTSTSGSLKWVVAWTIALARLVGSSDLKMPE